MALFTAFAQLLLYDLVFVGLACVVLAVMAFALPSVYAVLKRNFTAYFSTPNGYVFLCLFVTLSGFAAFWPEEFFNANLATLHQLNRWLPYVLLVFVPAVTMSVWAAEQQQGTDELLLTMPTRDLDIVLGKFLSAVAIFSASLLFSQITTFSVLNWLSNGALDVGQFMANYVGYWFVGLAMISLGMVASFLTSNLTVAFILGVAFNSLFVFSGDAASLTPLLGSVIERETAIAVTDGVRYWSFSSQIESFGRGVLSLSAVVFFAVLAAIGVYLSVILIGRRHWLGGRESQWLIGHFAVRTAALLIFAFSATALLANRDLRWDWTDGDQVSLAPGTVRIMQELDSERPVLVEAFISGDLPEVYRRRRAELLSTLSELRSLGGTNIRVEIHDRLNLADEIVENAKTRYGIEPRSVPVFEGVVENRDVLMGVAITSGVEKVVAPFLGAGVPIEYELARGIATVSKERRKRLGVLRTSAELTGGFRVGPSMQPQQIPEQQIIEELRRQYEVVDVDPTDEIPLDAYHVLLVAQPSSLSQPELDNLRQAIRRGQPTILFEDPLPFFFAGLVPGTDEPPQQQGMRPPQPKGNFQGLLDELGLELVEAPVKEADEGGETAVVWQSSDPYPGADFPFFGLWVFAEPLLTTQELRELYAELERDWSPVFNAEEPAVAGFQQVGFPAPGAVLSGKKKGINFTPLTVTSPLAGAAEPQELMEPLRRARVQPMTVDQLRLAIEQSKGQPTFKQYVLAAHLQSDDYKRPEVKPPADEEDDRDEEGEQPEEETPEGEAVAANLNVVYVADLDLMHTAFAALRAEGLNQGVQFRFQNVPYVLNLIDLVADDDRFLRARAREARSVSLKRFEQLTADAESALQEEINKKREEFETKRDELQEQLDEAGQRFEDLIDQERAAENPDFRKIQEYQARYQSVRSEAADQFTGDIRELEQELRREVMRERYELEANAASVRNQIKLTAVILPLLAPILIGLVVYGFLDVRENVTARHNVAAIRLGYGLNGIFFAVAYQGVGLLVLIGAVLAGEANFGVAAAGIILAVGILLEAIGVAFAAMAPTESGVLPFAVISFIARLLLIVSLVSVIVLAALPVADASGGGDDSGYRGPVLLLLTTLYLLGLGAIGMCVHHAARFAERPIAVRVCWGCFAAWGLATVLCLIGSSLAARFESTSVAMLVSGGVVAALACGALLYATSVTIQALCRPLSRSIDIDSQAGSMPTKPPKV